MCQESLTVILRNFMHFDSAVKVYTCHSSGQKLAWAGYHASGAPKCALCNIGFAISHDDTQCILTCVGLKVWLANAVVYPCKCLFHLIHAPILPNRVLEVLDYDENIINGRFQSKYQIILATIVVLSHCNNRCHVRAEYADQLFEQLLHGRRCGRD